MSPADWLPYDASFDQYERQAEALLDALHTRGLEARWAFKWEHPRFRGKPVEDVEAVALGIDDARLVIARRYGFETWAGLAQFSDAVKRDPAVAEFEAAVEAVV